MIVVLEVGGAILTVGFFGTIGLFATAAIGDVLAARKRRGVTARLRRIGLARVRARAIRTPAIRQRLEANRSIIQASMEQAVALRQQHDDKRQRHEENSKRWLEEFAALGGRARELEPVKPAKKEQKSAKATILSDPEDNRALHRLLERRTGNNTITYNGYTWRG